MCVSLRQKTFQSQCDFSRCKWCYRGCTPRTHQQEELTTRTACVCSFVRDLLGVYVKGYYRTRDERINPCFTLKQRRLLEVQFALPPRSQILRELIFPSFLSMFTCTIHSIICTNCMSEKILSLFFWTILVRVFSSGFHHHPFLHSSLAVSNLSLSSPYALP